MFRYCLFQVFCLYVCFKPGPDHGPIYATPMHLRSIRISDSLFRTLPRIIRWERKLTCMASSELKNRKLLVSHILIKDAAKATIIFDDLERQLSSTSCGSGISFSDLARQHSECSQSSQRGGQLGWLSRGTFFPEFEAAAFEAGSPGRISRALTSVGSHLIRVDEVRDEAAVQHMDPTELFQTLSNPALVSVLNC